MKVFHFILDHRVGGPHVYVRSITQALSPACISTVVTTGKGDATDMALTNLRHRFKWLYPIEVIWNMIRLCWHFRTHSSREGVIFDVHGGANIAPIFAARVLGIPLLWHFHETLASFASLVKLGKFTATGMVHRCVIVAGKIAKVFKIESATLIPGAVDASFWCADFAKCPKREPHNILRLVTVGNLNPLKGIDVLLDALGGVTTPWKLVVVGAELRTFSKYGASLHDQANKLASSDRQVEFAGWQSSDSIRDRLAWADVFVLPSRSEACPIALLEAMAMECVCIASDVGDVCEILSDPHSGFVVHSESSAQLTAALNKVAALQPSDRLEIGRSARESIIKRYSLKRMAECHLKIYTELLREAEELN